MNLIDKTDHNTRLRLYNAGYCDAEITRICYVGRDTIGKWRKLHNLPIKGKKGAHKVGRPRKEAIAS
jgi:hypothetical protein